MRTKLVCKFILALLVTAINSSAQNVSPFYKDGKMGFKNTATGEVVAPARFDGGGSPMFEVSPGNYFALVINGQKAGYINERGEIIIPLIYDNGSMFSNGLACVKLGNKYGYINIKGETVIPFEHDFARSFSGGLARVMKNGKAGFIDVTGNVVIALKYSDANDFANGLAPVMTEDGKWGFINAQGQYMIAPKYTSAESFVNGEAIVNNGEKSIHIDVHGNILSEMGK